MSLQILAVGPHPDDVELGCGGTLARSIDRGAAAVIVDLTLGEMSSVGTPDQRLCEARTAARVLGVRERINLELPDTNLRNTRRSRLALISLLRHYRPDVVLAPYEQDRHPDHRAASDVVRDACFLAGVGKVGHGEPHRPRAVFYYPIHHAPQPSFVVDISSTWQRKWDAICAFKSQFRHDGATTPLNTGFFLRSVEARGVFYGAMINVDYGEPLVSRGPLAISDLSFAEEICSRLDRGYAME